MPTQEKSRPTYGDLRRVAERIAQRFPDATIDKSNVSESTYFRISRGGRHAKIRVSAHPVHIGYSQYATRGPLKGKEYTEELGRWPDITRRRVLHVEIQAGDAAARIRYIIRSVEDYLPPKQRDIPRAWPRRRNSL